MLRLVVCAALACAVSACESTSTRSAVPLAPTSTNTTVAPATLTITGPAAVYSGVPVQLGARLRFSDGSVVSPEKVTWATSRADLATVDAHGRLTGSGGGDVTITATAVGLQGHLDVWTRPDYRGTWTGQAVRVSCRGAYCTPRWYYPPRPEPGPASLQVLLAETDGAVTGRVLFGDELDDEGWVAGSVSRDGTLTVSDVHSWPRIFGWRTTLRADGTMTGSFTTSLGEDALEIVWEVTLTRRAPGVTASR